MSNKIVERYAQSLFELANESNKLPKIHRDLNHIAKVIDESNEFNVFVKNPVLTKIKRKEILKAIFKNHVDGLTFSFIEFLESKGRLEFLAQLTQIFEKKYLEFNNTVKAVITSAVKLNDHQVKEIVKHLTKKLSKEIVSICEINPDLIGGVKIQIDDYIYDYSIETQLKSFQQSCVQV